MTAIFTSNQPDKLPGLLAPYSSPDAMTEGFVAFWRESFDMQSQMTAAVIEFWMKPFMGLSGAAEAEAPETVLAPRLVLKSTSAPSESVRHVQAAEPAAMTPAAHVAVESPTPARPIHAEAGTGTLPEVEVDVPELFATPKGKADDLTRIKGIGPKLAGMLNETGVWHYSQIASWTPAETTWINSRIGFGGRVQREAWQTQARTLAGN